MGATADPKKYEAKEVVHALSSSIEQAGDENNLKKVWAKDRIGSNHSDLVSQETNQKEDGIMMNPSRYDPKELAPSLSSSTIDLGKKVFNNFASKIHFEDVKAHTSHDDLL